MNKEQIICYQIPIKSSKQLIEYKRRQQNPISTTAKILLGKLNNHIQQIWVQQYSQYKINNLRQLHSNDYAFDIAIDISIASSQLSKVYGNFILNQNMVFISKTKEIFIWINPDIFINSPKIYLPPGKQAQVSMVKSLINYLRLWLRTNYQKLIHIKTLQQLSVKLEELKKQKPPIINKDNSTMGFSFQSSSKQSAQKGRLYQSTKGIKIKRVAMDQYSKRNSKNSQNSQKNQKCFTNRCFTTQPLNSNQKYFKNQVQITSNSKVSNNEQNSSGQKGSFTNSFSKQSSRSFRNSKRQPKQEQSKFPNKTTSSTLHIIQKIKQQDENPDHYPANKILIEQSQNQNSQKTSLMKSSLGGINQELDNLFTSNIQSEQNQQQMQKRQKEFQDILNI